MFFIFRWFIGQALHKFCVKNERFYYFLMFDKDKSWHQIVHIYAPMWLEIWYDYEPQIFLSCGTYLDYSRNSWFCVNSKHKGIVLLNTKQTCSVPIDTWRQVLAFITLAAFMRWHIFCVELTHFISQFGIVFPFHTARIVMKQSL